MPSRNSSMKASDRTKRRAKERAPSFVCGSSSWASFMRCLPSAQARAPLERATDHAADVARITPIAFPNAAKMSLTLTRLHRYGGNEAGGPSGHRQRPSPQEGARKRQKQKKSRQRRLE